MSAGCICCRAQHSPEEAEASALALVIILLLLTATASDGAPGELEAAGRAGAAGVVGGLCARHRQAIEGTRVPTAEGRAARIKISEGVPS